MAAKGGKPRARHERLATAISVVREHPGAAAGELDKRIAGRLGVSAQVAATFRKDAQAAIECLADGAADDVREQQRRSLDEKLNEYETQLRIRAGIDPDPDTGERVNELGHRGYVYAIQKLAELAERRAEILAGDDRQRQPEAIRVVFDLVADD